MNLEEIKILKKQRDLIEVPSSFIPPAGSSKEIKDEWIENIWNLYEEWSPPNQEIMDKKIFENIIKIIPDYESAVESVDDFYTCEYELKFHQIDININSQMDYLPFIHDKITSEAIFYIDDFTYNWE